MTHAINSSQSLPSTSPGNTENSTVVKVNGLHRNLSAKEFYTMTYSQMAQVAFPDLDPEFKTKIRNLSNQRYEESLTTQQLYKICLAITIIILIASIITFSILYARI